MKSDHENLKPLLQSWSEVPAPNGRLAGPVWAKIGEAGERASWLGRLAMAVQELDARLARPGAIAAVVAVSILIGIGVAELRTSYDARQVDSEMSARYLSMLDSSNH